MANSKTIPGKLIVVSIGDNALDCQQDSTLNISYNVTEDTPCKPDPNEAYTGFSWQTSTTDSATWNISFTLNATDVNANNQNSILNQLINTSNEVSIAFETSQANGTGLAFSSIFEGDGLITDFSWNAPSEGVSTVDVTVQGNGEPTFSVVPVTT